MLEDLCHGPGGRPPDELPKSKTIQDAMMLGWLEFFDKS
jgi:hypothetical protein